MNPTSSQTFVRNSVHGDSKEIARELAVETPIAVEINGVGYAVLMASPLDLVDLVFGFFGKLRDVVRELMAFGISERNRMVLAFHDRFAPPYQIDGARIAALAEALRNKEIRERGSEP